MGQVTPLSLRALSPIPPIGEWFNATAIAVANGETPDRVQAWLSSAATAEYMEAMAESCGKGSRAELFRQEPDGLWLCSEMYVCFARWACPDFAGWADRMIAGGLIA